MSRDDVVEISSFIKSVWWLVLLRGIFAIILGILAFTAPVLTAAVFTWVFGFWVLIDGIINIVQALGNRKSDPTWGWLLTIGVLGVIVGLLVLIFPVAAGSLALSVFLWIIAIWAVVGGIFGIPAAASLASGGAKVLGIVFAALAIVFGVALVIALFSTPQSALLGLIYVLGAWSVLSGIVLVLIAIQARAQAGKALKAA